MIAVVGAGYRAAGVADAVFTVKINNRKLLSGLLSARGVADDAQRVAALRAMDKLDRLGARGVADLLGPGRVDESGAFTQGAQLPAAAIYGVLAFIKAGKGTLHDTLASLAHCVGGSAGG